MKRTYLFILLSAQSFYSFSQIINRDASFNSGNITANSTVRNIAVQADQKIVFAGEFTYYNSQSLGYIGRLDVSGSIDLSFTPPLINSSINTLAIQPWDNKIIIGGTFTSINGITRNGIARLNTDGTLDLSFNPGTGITGGYDGSLQVWSIAIKNDADPSKRRILVGGQFEYYNGYKVGSRGAVVQLLESGTRDASYDPQVSNGPVYSICLDKSNKLLIGGEFWNIGSNSVRRIARLNEDGTYDASFAYSGWGPYSSVTSVAIDNTGKVLIGGWFTQFSGITCNSIARLNTNGTLDLSFQTGTGLQGGLSLKTNTTEARSICVTPDNKIIVGGNFTKYNGVPCSNIISINEDGNLNTDYDFGTGFNDALLSVRLQYVSSPSFRILAGGFFNSYKAYAQGNIMRLIPIYGVLATKFSYTKAQREKNDVSLFWKTALEDPNYEVIIKRSTDGFHFYPVAHSTLSLMTQEKGLYKYTDRNAPTIKCYYKIQVISGSEIAGESDIMMVNLYQANENKIMVYSHTGSSALNLETHFTKAETCQVKMYAMDGRLYDQWNTQIREGITTTRLPLTSIPIHSCFIITIQTKETNRFYSIKANL